MAMGTKHLSFLGVSSGAGHEGPSAALWRPVASLGAEGRFLLYRTSLWVVSW